VCPLADEVELVSCVLVQKMTIFRFLIRFLSRCLLSFRHQAILLVRRENCVSCSVTDNNMIQLLSVHIQGFR